MSTNYYDLYLTPNSDGKYFRCDTVFVQSGNAGGRLFSTKPSVDTILPNGVFGYIGSHVDKEIRELLVPTSDLIKNQIPVLVHNPEINYLQISRANDALGLYRNRAGQVLRTFPLVALDEISLSEDYFDMTGKATAIAEGDIFTLQANLVAGTQLKYSATAPTATTDKVYFKVTKVFNSYIPSFLGGDGTLFPSAYKMIDVEMILA